MFCSALVLRPTLARAGVLLHWISTEALSLGRKNMLVVRTYWLGWADTQTRIEWMEGTMNQIRFLTVNPLED